jgi:DNA-binding LacI/PurR family transcriptional regulator
MPTIRQLAKIAKVSIATVSRALNNQPEVSPETRQRILELAERYQYRANRLTQGLLTGKSSVIGCLVPDVNSNFYSSVLRGVLEYAFTESYRVITLQTHHELVNTQLALQALVEQRVAGVLIASGHLAPIPRETLHLLRSHNIIPIAMDATTTAFPIDLVRNDVAKLATVCVDYLMGLGHRRIAFIEPLSHGKSEYRAQLMRQALQQRGLPALPVKLVEGVLADHVLQQIQTMTPSPTAVIAMTDDWAAQIIQQAIMAGVRVPRELSVIGCANLQYGGYLLPPLTTIEQFPVEIGRQAMQLLTRRIQEEVTDESGQPETIVIPPKLIERNSCATCQTP